MMTRRRSKIGGGIVRFCTNANSNFGVFVCATLLQLIVLQQLVACNTHAHAAIGHSKGQPRMRSAKIASIHGQQQQAAAATSLLASAAAPATVEDTAAIIAEPDPAAAAAAAAALPGKYEIRSVYGEPHYKSVNLTWEVEFVPATANDHDGGDRDAKGEAITNSSAAVDPPKTFQIFFCELQSFGPNRCRSKLVVGSQSMVRSTPGDMVMEATLPAANRAVRHYVAQIENLRMATKYSFHIRPQQRRRSMRIAGHSELFDNEIDPAATNEARADGADDGSIVIPTKGFSAQATKCLPHASEIEVETGPYFGGKIVVDGGSCGVKGNPDDAKEQYTMRIDHKMCGSLVKPETNTVETFITVQENLGIFTHSTRRFVVVCSYQSGMQTVRASFTVPGKGGATAAVEQDDAFEPDDRMSREHRPTRYVDRSALVLKEASSDKSGEQDVGVHSTPEDASTSLSSENESAIVEEVAPPSSTPAALDLSDEIEMDAASDALDAVAILEDIVPGVNEQHIKHPENEVMPSPSVVHANYAKYAKLMGDRFGGDAFSGNEWPRVLGTAEARASSQPSLQYITANAGSVVITISLSAILIGVFVFVVYREVRHLHRSSCGAGVGVRSSTSMQRLQQQQQQPKTRTHSFSQQKEPKAAPI